MFFPPLFFTIIELKLNKSFKAFLSKACLTICFFICRFMVWQLYSIPISFSAESGD
jgi:hypothetical protein